MIAVFREHCCGGTLISLRERKKNLAIEQPLDFLLIKIIRKLRKGENF